MIEPILGFFALILIVPFVTLIYWLVLLGTIITFKLSKKMWITFLGNLSLSAISYYIYCRYNPGYLDLNQAFWPFYAIAASLNCQFVVWVGALIAKRRAEKNKAP